MKSSKNGFAKIGKIAKDSELPVSTIRYYNQFGLINEIFKTPGGVRLFEEDETVKTIKKIRNINHGRSLEDIKELV